MPVKETGNLQYVFHKDDDDYDEFGRKKKRRDGDEGSNGTAVSHTWCVSCGLELKTKERMAQHLMGKKHKQSLAFSFNRSGTDVPNADDRDDDASGNRQFNSGADLNNGGDDKFEVDDEDDDEEEDDDEDGDASKYDLFDDDTVDSSGAAPISLGAVLKPEPAREPEEGFEKEADVAGVPTQNMVAAKGWDWGAEDTAEKKRIAREMREVAAAEVIRLSMGGKPRPLPGDEPKRRSRSRSRDRSRRRSRSRSPRRGRSSRGRRSRSPRRRSRSRSRDRRSRRSRSRSPRRDSRGDRRKSRSPRRRSHSPGRGCDRSDSFRDQRSRSPRPYTRPYSPKRRSRSPRSRR